MKVISNTLIKVIIGVFIVVFASAIISATITFIATLKDKDFDWIDWIGFLCFTVSAVAIGFWIRWAMF